MDLPSLELTVVPQRGAGQGGDGDRGGPECRVRELAGGSWLVVVLGEPQEMLLEVEVGGKVVAHGRRRLVEETVVEPLVVAVVEAELQQLPLEVPVGLGGEQHLRVDGSDGGDDLRPVLAPGHRTWSVSPCPSEHVVEHQHGHVAPHAIGQAADVDEGVDGGLPEPGSEGVELGDVGPWREVGVAPAGDHGVADGEELARRPRQVLDVAEDEVVRSVAEPGVIGGDVVGDEVDDEPGASGSERLAGSQEAVASAEPFVDLVAADAVGGPDHIARLEVVEGGSEVVEVGRRIEREANSFGAAVPYPHQPHGVDPDRRDAVPFRVGDAGQRRRHAGAGADVTEPGGGVDLVDDRIEPPSAHDCSAR